MFLEFLVWGGLGVETMARALGKEGGKESCLNMMLVTKNTAGCSFPYNLG